MPAFDLAALYDALDAQRQARGLTWTGAVREINALFVALPSRPISRSTVMKLKTARVGEGDGILQMLRWLDRTPESFVPGADASAAARLPDVPRDRILRFDTKKLYAALDAERASRGGWAVRRRRSREWPWCRIRPARYPGIGR